MTTTNLKSLTLEALEKMERTVAENRAQLSEEHKKIRAELDRRYAMAAAEKKFSGMSDVELEALAHTIQARGIASAEEFGKIGG